MTQTPMTASFQIDEAWLKNYFATVDTLQADAIVRNFTPDAQFHFASEPPAKGQEAIKGALSSFFDTIKGMHHQMVNTYIKDQAAVFEANVTYTRKDGSQVTLPCASILRFENDLITDFKMLMDISPVYKQAG